MRKNCSDNRGHLFRSLGELDELWVGSVLVGAKYDRHIPSLDTIRQGWHIAVRYSHLFSFIQLEAVPGLPCGLHCARAELLVNDALRNAGAKIARLRRLSNRTVGVSR